MNQIDFYILGENSHRNINQMVCKLCEKALTQNMNVLIYTQSSQQAQELDDILWTYKANSFIPHINQINLNVSDDSFFYPVLIHSADLNSEMSVPQQYNQLLINLSSQSPPFLTQFERLAEMVEDAPDEKNLARTRYRNYRQNGYHLNKYDL